MAKLQTTDTSETTLAGAYKNDLDRIQMLRRRHSLPNQAALINVALDALEREDKAKSKKVPA